METNNNSVLLTIKVRLRKVTEINKMLIHTYANKNIKN